MIRMYEPQQGTDLCKSLSCKEDVMTFSLRVRWHWTTEQGHQDLEGPNARQNFNGAAE